MTRLAPSFNKFLHIVIAADSLVSFVFDLKANPKITNLYMLGIHHKDDS